MAKNSLAVDDLVSMRQMVGGSLRCAGATGWVIKPFNPQQLLATMAKVI